MLSESQAMQIDSLGGATQRLFSIVVRQLKVITRTRYRV